MVTLATPVNLRRGTSGGTGSASDVVQFLVGFWQKVGSNVGI